MRPLRLILLFLGLFGWGPAWAQTDPSLLCRAAIGRAERDSGIPDGLLQAIGQVESGRRNPETGIAAPWPWTLNAEGRGQFFPTKEAAIAAVQELQGRGVRLIDVGCMQINLHHHPRAFANLAEAFDPAANARYAARFLGELQASRQDWIVAAGHYHSQTPDLAQAYRQRVQNAWNTTRNRTAEDRALASLPPAGGFSLSNHPERASVAMSGTGGGFGGSQPRGRGLDSYRSQPIPVTGRPFALVRR
ncbi:transglycosylase SLT domain-containing protein [Roseococcus sp. YIM B11640]|uniref:transglycosylase SLT domain-containing protein n=1 Tax=Roseococcus sp. YIM B11640 TaxID=3133973 RepID=UPI003C7B3B9C